MFSFLFTEGIYSQIVLNIDTEVVRVQSHLWRNSRTEIGKLKIAYIDPATDRYFLIYDTKR